MINFLKKKTNVAVNSTKITIKLFIILILILILLIPKVMIGDLVRERKGRQINATNRIAEKIGGSIDVSGPILSIPYKSKEENFQVDPNTNKRTKQILTVIKHAYFTANQLDIKSNSRVENKKKSIYRIPYFESDNVINASFSPVDFSKWDDIASGDILYNDAVLLVGISDLKSVLKSPILVHDGKSYEFEPGSNETNLFQSGVYVDLPQDFAKTGGEIRIEMDLRGTQALHFASVAQDNEMNMVSDWSDPDFEALNLISSQPNRYIQNQQVHSRGNTLPLKSDIDESGFVASWKENQFSIDQPKQWKSDGVNPNLYKRMMGASFINVADHYKKTDRSVKYMALIIALVFISFFIIELLRENKVHPFQYIMVGSAVAVFFLLLLAISEYSGFNLAYLVASIATTLLIGLYSWSVFKSLSMAISITILLSAIFIFLFVLLIAVQYSLLLGAIGLFVILAAIMFATRNVKWYGLREPNSFLNAEVEKV